MSQFIPVLFAVFALALVVGPIMLMRPTSSQKRIASIRSSAAQAGLIISAEREGVLYIQPWKESNKELVGWRLKRQKFSHGAHFFEDWDWQGEVPSNSFIEMTSLENLLARARSQQDYRAFGANAIGVFVLWNEKLEGNSVEVKLDELLSTLDQLMRLVPGSSEAPSES